MIGVAENTTDAPAHDGLADGFTETLTGSTGLTTITTGVEVAGFPVGQMAFEVRTTVTMSLFAGIYE